MGQAHMATKEDNKKMSELLFKSLEDEISATDLPVQGSIPKWLKGTLVRNGPSLFEIGDEAFQHWFDGQAMLHSFSFDGSGKVAYSNKLLDSANLRAHRKAGKVAAKEFVSAPKKNFFQRIWGLFSPSEEDSVPYENANVNIAKAGGKFFAMTEVPRWIEFDVPSVASKGVISFNDALQSGQMCSAHPITTEDGEHINFYTCLGPQNSYVIYRIKPDAPGHGEGQLERELIAQIPTKHAAYMHSFGVTDDYIVLVEFPLHFSVVNMISSSAKHVIAGSASSFEDMFEWRPERGTLFTVVKRADGAVVGQYKAPAFNSYHHANAFVDPQNPSKLHVDLMCYEQLFYDDLSLTALRTDAYDTQHPGQLRRYTVELEAGEAERQSGAAVGSRVLFDGECEFPVINDKVRGRQQRFVYGTGVPGSEASSQQQRLLRVDCGSGETKMWQAPGCYPGEGIFVAAPEAAAEDDGVVLSVVLDQHAERSFLLIVDASSLEEIARVDLPHHIPLGLHGFFFQ